MCVVGDVIVSALSTINSTHLYVILEIILLLLLLPVQLRDDEISAEEQEHNWFSAQSALRVYGEFTLLLL